MATQLTFADGEDPSPDNRQTQLLAVAACELGNYHYALQRVGEALEQDPECGWALKLKAWIQANNS